MPKLLILFLLLLPLLNPYLPDCRAADAVSPAPAQPAGIEADQLYALSELLHKEVESIRYIMGCPETDGPLLKIEDAELREVYFQAVSLYNKTTRLNYYLLLGEKNDLPASPKNIRPADVWQVLQLTLKNLHTIKKEYGIPADHTLPEIQGGKTPSDVYMSILANIRQVNQMILDHPYTPSDVFQEVTTAFYYMLNIYKEIPGLKMQPPPDFIPGKRPKDVYEEILETYQTIGKIMQPLGMRALTIAALDSSHTIKPSDVYDMAVLITSELKYIYVHIPGAQQIYEAVYPGIKFPSHVYQRVRHLHSQLQQILQEVEKNPLVFAGPK